ncbi:transporter substrate-binding domain-containing protein [Crocosphaera sp. UHCC 0190]|uniref:transporter substrate-binding domain-containing protein n=1 Tax=Crocosphaera sp. UHCC 0190 TaxID=3110246 RepID=UPI002B210F30|nr:transporter substrate-binding domain-containing protein [Crocosphaera sp. UHCC 0190]MEA5508430.1 transporter substrate-binding domain-containing protein [Crocosphaera sp. UHCC 0190]
MIMFPTGLLSLALWLTLTGSTLAVVQSESPPVKYPLKVGVVGSPPFSSYTNQTFKGISVELWQELAANTNLKYQFIAQPGVKTGINRVTSGELDVLIGPISITAARFKRVTFTQPYFKAQIGLLVSGESPSVWNRIKPLFQVAVISSVGGLFVILFIVGNLIWIAESRRNEEQFPKSYFRGVGNGIWFALVTLTTVGYGDKAPVTKTGKAVTSIWMLITMVAASSLTAGIATVMTLLLSQDHTEQFTQLQDLQGKQIAVVTGTTGAEWAKNYQARLLESPNLEGAIERLKSGKAKGVMFDVPALKYYLYQHPDAAFRIANLSISLEDYGFVLPLNSQLVREINLALIQLKESGRVEEIIEREIQGVSQE